jgi:mannitol/fructose-specific phosphotransferase system IIA component (Ntr-type)
MLVNYLSADRILFLRENASKHEVIETLLGTLKLPNVPEALQMVEEREEVGGIMIKPNVAIPHSSLPGITGVRAALGIQKRETGPFFWLVFVSGADSIKEHLEFLKATALSLTDEILETLGNCESAEKAMRILNQ